MTIEMRHATVSVMSDDVSATGPDPVWSLGVFIVGLLTMGVGGAATWHWVFNVGEAIMLLGATLFLAVVAWNYALLTPRGMLAYLLSRVGRLFRRR